MRDKKTVSQQRATKLVGDSATRMANLKRGIKEMVTIRGRQYWLQFTGVNYEIERLPEAW